MISLVTSIAKENGLHVTRLVTLATVLTVLTLPCGLPASRDQFIAVLETGFWVDFEVTVFADQEFFRLVFRISRGRSVTEVTFWFK